MGKTQQLNRESDPTSYSDEELMMAYQNGDIRAFNLLYERYHRPVYRYFRLKFYDENQTSDLFQECFLRVHRARATFDPSKKFSSWLFSIAAHLKIDAIRSDRRQIYELYRQPVNDDQDISPDQRSVEDDYIRNEQIQKLIHALEQIPNDQKEVILLHKFQGFSFREVADILGIKLESAKAKAFRGYKNLREFLLADDEDGSVFQHERVHDGR